MTPRATRLVHARALGKRHTVLLELGRGGAVIGAAVPATDWHAWSPEQRQLASLIADINASLQRGLSLHAQRRRAEHLVELLEQLEDAEALLGARAGGSA